MQQQPAILPWFSRTRTPSRVFSCKCPKNFQNSFLRKHIWTPVSKLFNTWIHLNILACISHGKEARMSLTLNSSFEVIRLQLYYIKTPSRVFTAFLKSTSGRLLRWLWGVNVPFLILEFRSSFQSFLPRFFNVSFLFFHKTFS